MGVRHGHARPQGALVIAVGRGRAPTSSTSVWPHGRLGTLLPCSALAVPAMFVHQLARGAARVQVVASLSAIALLVLGEVALPALLQLRHEFVVPIRRAGRSPRRWLPSPARSGRRLPRRPRCCRPRASTRPCHAACSALLASAGLGGSVGYLMLRDDGTSSATAGATFVGARARRARRPARDRLRRSCCTTTPRPARADRACGCGRCSARVLPLVGARPGRVPALPGDPGLTGARRAVGADRAGRRRRARRPRRGRRCRCSTGCSPRWPSARRRSTCPSRSATRRRCACTARRSSPRRCAGGTATSRCVGGLRIGDITGATLVAHLTNAYLPLRDLLGRRARELPCEHVEGRIVLPYARARPRRAASPDSRWPSTGERLIAVGRAAGAGHQPAGPGQRRGRSVARPAPVRCGCGSAASRSPGITLPSLVLNQLLPTLNVPIPLPPLPYGLRLDELRPTAERAGRRRVGRCRGLPPPVAGAWTGGSLPVWRSRRMCACR